MYYAYDPSDGTYWALAKMQPLASAPTRLLVQFQDGANRAILAQRNGSAWSVVNLVGEAPCLARQGLPVVIESLWGLTDASECAATTGPPASAPATGPPATSAPTTVPPTSVTPPTTTQPNQPGVVYDCTAAPPAAQQSKVRPTPIVLACADNGIGVRDLVWTNWTAGRATGTGKVWKNNCTPNRAEGTFGYYPATITLSGVVNTATNGLLFSQLMAAYQGPGPHGHTTDHFSLPLPPE